MLHPRSIKRTVQHLDRLVARHLWLKVLIALILGFGFGVAFGPTFNLAPQEMIQRVGSWLYLPGQLFIGLVQMIVVPLIFASIIRGLAATSDIATLKRLSWKMGLYFFATTTVAVTIGIGLAYLINPASYIDAENIGRFIDATTVADLPVDTRSTSTMDLANIISMLVPANPLSSLVNKEMLQIVIFAIIIGIALISMPVKQSTPMLDLLGSIQEVCMTIVGWAMRLAPYAVFGMTFNLGVNVGLDLLVGLGAYVLTVMIGMGILLGFYSTINFLVTRRSPLDFFKNTREVLLLAFSTSSSAAVMPLTTKTVEDKFRVRPSISQFIIPLGATVNMDGTALYQGVATVFLSTLSGIHLDIWQLALVVISVVFASIGAPSAPGVGIVILSTVLGRIGIAPQMVALIIGVDRILDMTRTVANVSGDITAAVVMDHWVGGTLTAEQENLRERQHETRRATTGEDVIVES